MIVAVPLPVLNSPAVILPANVLLTMAAVPSFSNPASALLLAMVLPAIMMLPVDTFTSAPPPGTAELLLTVLLIIASVPLLKTALPLAPSPPAVFPVMMLWSISTLPLFLIPPPNVPLNRLTLPPRIVSRLSVNVPLASTLKIRNTAVGTFSLSMVVTDAPSPRIVSELEMVGSPFEPLVVLSTAVSV